MFFNSVSAFQQVIGTRPVKLTGDGIAYNYTNEGGVIAPTTASPIESSIDYRTTVSTGSTKSVSAQDLQIDADTFMQFDDGLECFASNLEEGAQITVVIDETPTTATVTSVTNPQTDPDPQFTATFTPAISGPSGSISVSVGEGWVVAYAYGDSQTGTASLSDVTASVSVELTGTYKKAHAATGHFFAAGSLDNGYIYASELLSMGIPVYYCAISGTTAQDVYDALTGTGSQKSVLLQLVDRGTYNVKYITSGGYPSYEYNDNSLAKLMLQVAGAQTDDIPTTDDYEDDPTSEDPNGRGDAVAFIDHFEIDERPLWGAGSIFEKINSSEQKGGFMGTPFLSFGAMFTPYANYQLSKNYLWRETNSDPDGKENRASTHYFPASFAYLCCLAKQLSATIPSYEAIAGVARGSVSNIVFDTTTNSYQVCTKEVLTNYIANHYNLKPEPAEGEKYKISINGITQINPYGLVIYGTRTLAKKSDVEGVKATGILNIRNMVSDIKKQMYQSARRYMYAANNDALWINFRSSVVGLLNQMQQGYGIKSWSLKKDMAKSTKSSLYVLCSIQPVYPVEKFDITIEITDEDIEVNEA